MLDGRCDAGTYALRARQAMLASGEVVALEERARRAILAAVDCMAAGALRCLACAHRGDLGDLATYDGDEHPVPPSDGSTDVMLRACCNAWRAHRGRRGGWATNNSNQPYDA